MNDEISGRNDREFENRDDSTRGRVDVGGAVGGGVFAGVFQKDADARLSLRDPFHQLLVIQNSLAGADLFVFAGFGIDREILGMNDGDAVAEKFEGFVHDAVLILIIAGVDQIHGIKNDLKVV